MASRGGGPPGSAGSSGTGATGIAALPCTARVTADGTLDMDGEMAAALGVPKFLADGSGARPVDVAVDVAGERIYVVDQRRDCVDIFLRPRARAAE